MVELLRTKGPTASGTVEILGLARAPRGSFYFHFPGGKEQLVAEAVGVTGAATEAAMAEALADGTRPLSERVERLITAVADELEADEYRLGCGVAATVVDAAATSAPLREATATAFATWSTTLVAHLTAEGVPDAEAAVLADAIIAGLEGATMLARARRDATALRSVATAMAALVAASVGLRRSRGVE